MTTVSVRLVGRRSLARRRATGVVVRLACTLATLVALAALVAVLGFTVARGVGGLSWGFLVHSPTPPGVPGGGISTAIAGSAEIVGLALMLAVPTSLLAALFLYERSGRLTDAVRFAADVLTGVPSIVIGIFAYAVVVRTTHHFSDLAAAFAIAFLMMPIMIRADEEALRAVPVDLWEAGMALGAGRGRVARSVVVRGALPGLVTGNLLALARGVGETAPLLFTLATPAAAMTLVIFTQGTQAFSAAQQTAWTTALVLLLFVTGLSIAARATAWALNRNTR